MSETEEIYEIVADIDADLVESASDLEELMELLLFLGFPTI
jgi:predicted transcriptional regulator